MNICKKLLSVLLVSIMLLCTLSVGVAVNAASSANQTIKAYAGDTVTLTMTEDSCYGIDGDISYSNRDLFSSVTPGSSTYGQIREKKFILSSSEKFVPTVKLTVKISSSAAVGSTCVVTFNYIRTDDVVNGVPVGPDDVVKKITVEVIKKDATSSTTSKPATSSTTSKPATSSTTSKPATSSTTSKPDTSSTASTSSTVSNAPTSTTTPSTNPATPSAPSTTSEAKKLNLTELNKQINIAQGLNSDEYTTASWNALKKALNAAISARKASTQAEVDKAAKNLKNAIAGLVRIDKNALQELIDLIKDFLAKEDIGDVRDALLKALDEAEAAIISGDQDRINAAYTALSEAFEAYKAKLAEIAKNSLVEIEKPVEVDPEGPFCNISLHILWLILLIVSAVINVAFIVLTILYFVRRKKKFADTMPLVDYNINDD